MLDPDFCRISCGILENSCDHCEHGGGHTTTVCILSATDTVSSIIVRLPNGSIGVVRYEVVFLLNQLWDILQLM
ncbi:hypothetical protein RIF29_33532 [Crotalaria pallida]|uniref:Uncharacterized protein n=1 Tax=Crotalaria pallida TaxID=3830 RepID=A0AAN9E7W4_CROPI